MSLETINDQQGKTGDEKRTMSLEPVNLEPMNFEPMSLEPMNLEPWNYEPWNDETSNDKWRNMDRLHRVSARNPIGV